MKLTEWIMIVIGLVILISPVIAAITDIPAGGAVFLGEQGLDITAGLGANNQIAWFPSTATSTSVTPEKIIDVTSAKTNFYATSSEFSGYMGNWYSWAPGLTVGTATVAFRIVDPYLAIKVDDVDTGVDATSNKWIYRGDEARFRLETNLYPMAERPGVAATAAPITIKVQTPDGSTLTSLVNKAGNSNSLVDIPVAKSPFTTNAFWDTGNAQYSAGTYTVWAESNANNMKDNYPQEGKTISSKRTIQVTEFNPLLKATAPTTAPSVKVTTMVTTRTTAAPSATTVITTLPTTNPLPAATTEAVLTFPTTTPATSAPTRTYADGFTALAAAASFCGAAWLLIGRFR
jgi:hypothetical protein